MPPRSARLFLIASKSLIVMLALSWSPFASAIDGGPAAQTTYLEAETAGLDSGASSVASSELPAEVHKAASTASLRYSPTPNGDGTTDWTVSVNHFARSHERIDGVYHMILALPLPTDPSFSPLQWSIPILEGNDARAVPMIYGGEKISLKRNTVLERTLLPRLQGADERKLSDLAGSGYQITLWDAIVKHDPGHGDTIHAYAELKYRTEDHVEAPDASDPQLVGYSITWLPSLDPDVAPFAVEIDVVD